jgi:hypothetical protein
MYSTNLSGDSIFKKERIMKRVSGAFLSFLLFICLSQAATLTVGVEPANIGINTITPSIGVHEYDAGQTVDLAALSYVQCPSVYQFDHWTGDVNNAYSANTTVLMNGNKAVTAVFVLANPVCGDQCHPNFTVGDLNHDCIVDLGDFAVLASRWMNCTKPECDELPPPTDFQPPMPNPAQWATPPYQNGVNSIRMAAAAAVDPEGNGVQYAFICSENPSLSSGWIASNTYVTPASLVIGQTYTFRVKYRDNSINQNETAFSSAVDTEPPMPNPPTITSAVRITILGQAYHVVTASVVMDTSGVEYQFECLTDPVLMANAVHVEWINTGNMVSGIYSFNDTLFPNMAAKVPNKIWIPVYGTINHTYRVRTRDQSPARNTSMWSSPVTTQ